MSRPARFLVLRGGAIGDFLLTLPVFQALRARWPDAWIEVLGYPHVAGLASAAGLVNRVDSLDRAGVARLFSVAPDFPEEQVRHLRSFDFVLSYLHDPTGLVRENLKSAGARVVLHGSPIVERGHAVEHLMKPLESLAIYAGGEHPSLALPGVHREAGRRWFRERGLREPVLAVHPGSGSAAKNWPLDRFVEAARRIGAARHLDYFYVLGEADRGLSDALHRMDGLRPVLKEAPLLEVAGVLSGGRLYLGNDSGITHLAAAVGVPTVALFGPSDAVRWGPRGPLVRVVRAPDSDLNELAVDVVLQVMDGLLA
ncbi:MAG TPA: glycosyltransferase family 9 protein [Kiritimatiellia bacterium]|nr:glycosyltransferase family 9 protein [Kiritimatiellia bacterium]HRZ11871.1 glycosyltransferase family 9 protein [Kiritimatiellia bacterium]HSA17323.1 glycosyltransferase family 9 protein [Kiritimatiellia bacterium]